MSFSQKKRKLRAEASGREVRSKGSGEDLHRFAGSSDDDGPTTGRSDKVESSDDEQGISEIKNEASALSSDEDKEDGNNEIGEVNDIDSYASADENQHADVDDGEVRTGMAAAMARILGRSLPKTKVHNGQKKKNEPSSVVLSRTRTPLQKLAEQEREKEKAQKEKRRLNLEKKELEAFHIPLTTNPTLISTAAGSGGGGMADSSSLVIAKEIEHERLHKRIDTRGVVALFNAIAQHQKGELQLPLSSSHSAAAASSSSSAKNVGNNKKNTPVTKMTKHGFLDMIKSKALGASAGGKDRRVSNSKEEPEGGSDKNAMKEPRWTALRDDFMLNPKENWGTNDDTDDKSADEHNAYDDEQVRTDEEEGEDE